MRIELLGELFVRAEDGTVADLPASRKTRALLAYLVLTGRRHLRSHLCDLLWDGADDPRGALRWSLSRLRAALDAPSSPRIESDRQSIAIVRDAVSADIFEARGLLGDDVQKASIDALRRCAELFRGELLEGLELLDAFRFHAWCTAEREAARALRVRCLSALTSRVEEPEEGLLYAHQLVSLDPMNEDAQTRVIGRLVQMGRHGDAHRQWDTFRRMLELELGEVPKDVSARVRKVLHDEPATAEKARRPERARREPSPAPPAAEPAVVAVPFFGRDAELETLSGWLSERSGSRPIALLSGDPGVGKTRLMQELARTAAGGGARVIGGRAYRAESGRAFGPWRDALAAIGDAGTVFSSLGDKAASAQHRTELFDAILAILVGQAKQDARPLLVTLDDVQWLDEASAAFLHYMTRLAAAPTVKVLATVRPAEVVDSPAVEQIIDALRTDERLLELALRPLEPQAVELICGAVRQGIDPQFVYAKSEGNPFVAVEMARALARGERSLPASIGRLLEGRLRLLSDQARELLPWAAALGRTFSVDALERVTGLDALTLVERVGELEARGVLGPHGQDGYDFTHDLVRDAAYRELSGPRRRMVHRRIARVLDASTPETGAHDATELLRHAELAGEPAIACRASMTAARDALSVCAWVEALSIADRGLQHTASLPQKERLDALLTLLECRVVAASILQRAHPDHVDAALREAKALGGSAEQVSKTLHLIAVLHFDHGSHEPAPPQHFAAKTGGDVDFAAAASRVSDPENAVRQLGNAARCLLHLEQDVGRARALLEEAGSLREKHRITDLELCWGEALLARWDGDLARAIDEVERALDLARSAEDRWREASCTVTLTQLCFEAGEHERVTTLARERLSFERDAAPAPKSPFVHGLAGLSTLRLDGDIETLTGALDELRDREARVQLGYLLAHLARFRFDRGELEAAEAAAREARQHAEAAKRSVPLADALTTLCLVHLERDDVAAARQTLAEADALAEGDDTLTKNVRDRLRGAAKRLAEQSF